MSLAAGLAKSLDAFQAKYARQSTDTSVNMQPLATRMLLRRRASGASVDDLLSTEMRDVPAMRSLGGSPNAYEDESLLFTRSQDGNLSDDVPATLRRHNVRRRRDTVAHKLNQSSVSDFLAEANTGLRVRRPATRPSSAGTESPKRNDSPTGDETGSAGAGEAEAAEMLAEEDALAAAVAAADAGSGNDDDAGASALLLPLHNRMSPTTRARWAYRLDNFFSSNPFSKLILLAGVTAVLITIGGLLYWLAALDVSFGHALWVSWTIVADPGTHADETGVLRKLVGFVLTLGGMMFFALFVGLIGESIEEKVRRLKRGTSRVLESRHTLILNWTNKTIPALKQLCIANESEGGGVVVVLANRDKEAMDAELAAEMADQLRGTTIVTRCGNPVDTADLRSCSVPHARAVLVLSPDALGADEADASVVRSCLALASFQTLNGHIIVELRDVDNLDIARLAMAASKVKVIPIVCHDMIGRVMVQCSREPGLAKVFESLLRFDASEFYMQHWPTTVGCTFEQALFSFPDAIVVGVLTAPEPASESGAAAAAPATTAAVSATPKITLAPEPGYVIGERDSLIVIAEDNDSYAPTAQPAPVAVERADVMVHISEPAALPERVLFVGWRRDIEDLISELDKWVCAGSELTIFAPLDEDARLAGMRDGVMPELRHLSVRHVTGNPILRRELERVHPEQFDVCLVLSTEHAAASTMSADSYSVVTMLLLRDIQMQRGNLDCVVVTEIMDPRTKSLISMARCSDYVISSELAALALTQIAENADLANLVEQLFTEEGAELHIKHAWLYVEDGEVLSFWQVQKRALLRGHVLIGYRQASMADFLINPPNKATPMTWTLGCYFVVCSEH